MSDLGTPDITTDLLVVGGGINGLSLAVAAARAGIAVVLIDERAVPDTLAPEFDGRVSAVAYASIQLLKAIGTYDALAPFGQPILDIRVSDGRLDGKPAPFFLHFDHRDVGDAPFGLMLENRHIRMGLHQVIATLPLITLIAPAQVTTTTRTVSGACAHLADGRIIAARLIAACDGRPSPLRERAGIKLIAWDYAQTGIVTTVTHERPHHGVAHEHFLPSGPFAILPMTGNRSSLVWSEKAALAPALLKLDHAAFNDEIRRRFGDHLGHVETVGPRFSYPLSFQFASRFIETRLALVGDAAHGIHPIAGQGFNLGLRDVAALAEVLVDGKRLGLDLGDPTLLTRYERWRRLDSVVLATVMDGLTRLFSNDIGPIRLARGLGLAAVERMPSLKRFFMNHARGSIGTLPRLLKGEPL